MTVFKCKMCGGTLEVKEGVSVAECEYCGTTQTLPTSNDEVLVNLFNRANNLRIKCEFDKAAEVYEKILDVDNTQAEAHWGIVLCKYGVEYVEDPHTNERIPTCHRTQMESILTDADYQSTIKYADTVAASVYETQAKEINELQKKILQIVKSEKPFDVFICYKETDDAGTKTRDSVIANEIYHELTNSGMKVFFAAITLEDKLGEEYEPYIYAALTSAKVMLVLGTKPEYFNAVWVKNEWSRYLHLMRTDREKKRTLIPCFRDMDAYDLPDDFSHLQALDMASIAFIPDLMRNIKKLAGKEQDKQTASQTDNGALPLLRRAYLFLEDGDFQRADELLEEVLNRDPENARAYIGKLLVSHGLRTEAELATLPEPFSDNPFYVKAHRFADDKYRKTLEKLSDDCVNINTEKTYLFAKVQMEEGDYISAKQTLIDIKGYKDTEKLLEECEINGKKQLCDEACAASEHFGSYGAYIAAVRQLEGIVDCPRAEYLRKRWIDEFKNWEHDFDISTIFIAALSLVPFILIIAAVINVLLASVFEFWLLPDFNSWIFVLLISYVLSFIIFFFSFTKNNPTIYKVHECQKCGKLLRSNRENDTCPHCGSYSIQTFKWKPE